MENHQNINDDNKKEEIYLNSKIGIYIGTISLWHIITCFFIYSYFPYEFFDIDRTYTTFLNCLSSIPTTIFICIISKDIKYKDINKSKDSVITFGFIAIFVDLLCFSFSIASIKRYNLSQNDIFQDYIMAAAITVMSSASIVQMISVFRGKNLK